jgi:signal transduction histidine kinase
MSRFEKVSSFIGSKVILFVLSSVIIIHIGMMFYYLQDNRAMRQKARHDAVSQKIMNTIFMLQAMPERSRANAVKAVDDPDLKISLTKQPRWDLRFYTLSFWKINKMLSSHLNNFTASLRLNNSQWLNLNATIYSRIFSEQLIFIAVEIFIFSTLLISAWSINRFTRPLKRFKQVAERLGIDLDAKPLDIYGPSVVREASEAMNKMQQRIRDLIHDRTQMLAAISHDLRTPITRMKLRSQFLGDPALSESYSIDLDEMEQMINETLAFAREDYNREHAVSFDLVSMIQTICDDTQDMGSDIMFHTRCHRIALTGRPLVMKRAVTNLINNGLRYGDRVEVRLFQRGKSVFIYIDDDGPGIPEQDLQRVFAPYYRREQSRSRDTGGVGLGLAVTQDIIKAHHGRVSLKNRRPKGLRVVVELPVLF